MTENNINGNGEFILSKNLKIFIYRYISHWPYIFISIILLLALSYIFIRYAEFKYDTAAKIQILDKSQDSEMALPTAMTIFNRSLVNLENEIGNLNSFSLNAKTASKLKSNIKYYSSGSIKTSENHRDEWFQDYEIKFKIDTDTITSLSSFEIDTSNNILEIYHYDSDGKNIDNYVFKNFSTHSQNHDLPFELKINNFNEDKIQELKIIKFYPFDYIVHSNISLVSINKSGKESDQLDIRMRYPNVDIAEEYLSTLISEFDRDGIEDRQYEYKRTIDFVNSRSLLITAELEVIELKRQKFKQDNNLTDISTDATININQQFTYDSELFLAESQLDLINLLNESFNNSNFELLPSNIGIQNEDLNALIINYNLLITEKDKYMMVAGKNNSFIKTLNKQIDDYYKNISITINNYRESLELTIRNLNEKENEFYKFYKSIPKNEKILRSIERELEIKEALFLLLLQKKEESSINFAVVKPSIKIIDYPISSIYPVTPNSTLIILIAIIAGFLIPGLIIQLFYELNTKLQTKCMEFLKYDDIKKYFVNPTFTLLYNELYLYIMLICVYHIFFILIILTIIYMLLQVLNNIKTLELKINSNYA